MVSWKSLFGSKRAPAQNAPSDLALGLRKEVEDNLEILNFLSTCGTFNLGQCKSYIALSTKLGKSFDANQVRQLEGADQMVGGYERLWIDVLVPTHLETFTTMYTTLIKSMGTHADASTLKFLSDAQKQFATISASLMKSSEGYDRWWARLPGS